MRLGEEDIKTISKFNKLIAHFMKLETVKKYNTMTDEEVLEYKMPKTNNEFQVYDDKSYNIDELPFHKDWNWIQPVITKIFREEGFIIFYHTNCAMITHVDVYTRKVWGPEADKLFTIDAVSHSIDTVILAVWEVVAKFLIWLIDENHG